MTSDPILPDEIATAEAEAALALGRLDGALRHLPSSAERILAGRLLRETLITALRQEGHAFTPTRFHAWLAGLVPLADASEPTHRALRPPRAMVLALLTALGHARWAPLAAMATTLMPAVLAVADINSGDGHRVAHDLLAEARKLLTALERPPSPLPFVLLTNLHAAVGDSTSFAPLDRSPTRLGPKVWRLTIEQAPAPTPRWAIEAQLGELLHTTGLLHLALPCPGLIQPDALSNDTDGRLRRALSLRGAASRLALLVDEAHPSARQLRGLRSARRTTSRMPTLFEWLVGFGALRSAQIEVVVGATRLGVRSMLEALDDSGVLTRETIVGAHLYGVAIARPPAGTETVHPPALSSGALSEYDASMADLDALLSRLGVNVDESNV